MPVLSSNILLPLIFIIIGLVLLFIFFRNLAKVRASQDWSVVEGMVVKSWVRRSQSTDSDGSVSSSYYPEIRYQYQVMGSEYLGDKITFGPKAGGRRSTAEKVVARYPTGSKAMIYFQPDKPANAVLERSVTSVLLVMGIVFVLAGIFFYVRWG